MSVERYPDIEVYLAPLDIDALGDWLKTRINADLKSNGKRKWRATGLSEQSLPLPILLMEAVTDGFASLWIDSNASPWPRDVDLARELNKALGMEVRCSLGGWHPGDAPDRFLCVNREGQEEVIDWPDHDAS